MRSWSLATSLFLAAAVPGVAVADRGALTVELGPALAWWPSMGPAVGSGSGISGMTGGGMIGVRYGLRNDLDLTATGFYEAPANFTNTETTVDAQGGSFAGTLMARTTRWGGLLGARWVHGLVWRWYLGGEIGWARQSFTKLDLINVSDPANPHSFGLGLADRSAWALVLSPLAGVEWQFADHWSVTFTPRVQILVAGVGGVAVVLPMSIGYSWYGL